VDHFRFGIVPRDLADWKKFGFVEFFQDLGNFSKKFKEIETK